MRGQGGVNGSKGKHRVAKRSEAYVILGFRVPTTSVGVRGERARRSKVAKGSEAYCILDFRVPTTSVGAWSEGQRESKGGKGE